MTRPVRVLGAGLLAALCLPAGAFAHVSKHRAAHRMATRVLLRRQDLGWGQSAPAPAQVSAVACVHPATGEHELARAGSPTFARNSQGPFASELDAVFASSNQVRSWWGQDVRPALAPCFAKVLASGSSSSVKLKPRTERMRQLTGASGKVALFRVTGEADSSSQSVPVYLDALLISSGRCLGELQVSTFQEPPSRSLELALIRVLDRRMANASRSR